MLRCRSLLALDIVEFPARLSLDLFPPDVRQAEKAPEREQALELVRFMLDDLR